MALELRRALGAAVILGFAAAPAAHAQDKRPWMDPPAGTPPAPAPEKAEAPPPAASPPPQATPAASPARPPAAAATKPARVVETEPVSRPTTRRLARKKPPKPVETAAKPTPEKRQVEARPSPSRRTVEADQPRRDRIIREGRADGLEVMTLRTIEFPDGRRVQVLTRPDPATVSDLLGE